MRKLGLPAGSPSRTTGHGQCEPSDAGRPARDAGEAHRARHICRASRSRLRTGGVRSRGGRQNSPSSGLAFERLARAMRGIQGPASAGRRDQNGRCGTCRAAIRSSSTMRRQPPTHDRRVPARRFSAGCHPEQRLGDAWFSARERRPAEILLMKQCSADSTPYTDRVTRCRNPRGMPDRRHGSRDTGPGAGH